MSNCYTLNILRTIIRYFIFFILSSISISRASGDTLINPEQNDSIKLKLITKNTIYIEALGNAIVGSINYDRILLSRGKSKISTRIGFFMVPDKKVYLSLPFSVNYLLGNKNLYESSVGLSYFYRDRYYDATKFTSSMLYLTISPLGYRFQKSRSGVFFKANALVFIHLAEFNKNFRQNYPNYSYDAVFPYLSIGIGYSF